MHKKREAQLAWVTEVMQRNLWNKSEWARKANVHHSTLSKFLSNNNCQATLSNSTLKKLIDVIPGAQSELKENDRSRTTSYPTSHADCDPWQVPEHPTPQETAIHVLNTSSPDLHSFVINTPALNAKGIFPGDILVVDSQRMPKRGDTVFTRICDAKGDARETFRINQTPFVTGAQFGVSNTPPTLIDNVQAAILGTVISVFRAL